jgi:hypothetical protein
MLILSDRKSERARSAGSPRNVWKNGALISVDTIFVDVEKAGRSDRSSTPR